MTQKPDVQQSKENVRRGIGLGKNVWNATAVSSQDA